jgi:hypothetical protein
MALRDKLHERVQPYLRPGEQVEEVFPAQGGISPWLTLTPLGALGAVFLLPFITRRIVVVTTQAIVVLEASKVTFTAPKGVGVIARLPRQTVIGPARSLWAKCRLGDEKLYVHRRYHQDIRRANERAGAASGAA